jgi:predicted site-specific integrase-resolvase
MNSEVITQLPAAAKLGLNRHEAAKAIGVSPATLDRLTMRGLLRPCRVTRRPIYFVEELARFLREHTVADYELADSTVARS